jgi:hypothetical protein
LVLLFTPSPFLAKLLSAACIYLAHYVSSSVASMDATTIWFQPFLDSLVIIYFLKKVRRVKRVAEGIIRSSPTPLAISNANPLATMPTPRLASLVAALRRSQSPPLPT